MRSIPCTIDIIRTRREECWILSVSVDAANSAAAELSGLLSGHTKKIVFSDGKDNCTVTTDSISLRERQIHITKTWLECLQRLFSDFHTSHIDYDFSDRHGDVSITVRIT